jgi:hypothetical protein
MGSRINVSSSRSCVKADFVISVEFYYSAVHGFWPLEDLAELAAETAVRGEVARGGCSFALNFSVTSLPILMEAERKTGPNRHCLCISPSWPTI